jgi:hypothetical protein
MQEFIKWGGLTPEELKAQQDQAWQDAIMIAEARIAAQLSAVGASGANRTISEFTQTSLFVFIDNANPTYWKWFAADNQNIRFSEVYVSDLETSGPEQWDLQETYPIGSGYALTFTRDGYYKFVFIDKFGGLVDEIQMGPSGDVSWGEKEALAFYAFDFDGNHFVTFNGVDVFESHDLLGDNLVSISVGANNNNIGMVDGETLLVRLMNRTNDIGTQKIVGITGGSTTFGFEVQITTESLLEVVNASNTSPYFVIVQRLDDSEAGYPVTSILVQSKNGDPNLPFLDELSGISYYSVDYYGQNGGLIITTIDEAQRKFYIFDPVRSTTQFDVIAVNNTDYDGHYFSMYTRTGIGNIDNRTPHDTLAIVIYSNLQNSGYSNGYLKTAANLAIVSKFEGDEPAFDGFLEFDAFAATDLAVSDQYILLPTVNPELIEGSNVNTFSIKKITPTSRLTTEVDGLSGPISMLADFEIIRFGSSAIFRGNGTQADAKSFTYINPAGNIPVGNPTISVTGVEQYNQIFTSGLSIIEFPDGAGTFIISEETGAWDMIETYDDFSFSDSGDYVTEFGQLPPHLLQNQSAPRLYWFRDKGDSTTGNIVIGDGGNDMYDGGNFLNTDLDQGIPYTHTSIANSGEEVQTISDFQMNGSIVAGNVGFGASSSYFTNLYPGLFVMSATGIEANEFSISGNNGADGSGTIEAGQITLTDLGYVVSYKCISGAGDPSINQIIITKRTPQSGLPVHDWSSDTDSCDQVVSNLVELSVTEIHYLLFALANGRAVTVETITDLVTAFINVITSGQAPNTTTKYLANLNQNYGTVLASLPPHDPINTFRIIKPTEISTFTIPSNYTNRRVGPNGLYVIVNDPTRNYLLTIKVYNLDGQLVRTIETPDTNVDRAQLVKDRYIAITYTDGDGQRTYTVTIFSKTEDTQFSFTPTNGYNFSINDTAWWWD